MVKRMVVEPGYPSLLAWSPDGKFLAVEYRGQCGSDPGDGGISRGGGPEGAYALHAGDVLERGWETGGDGGF